MHTLKLRVNDKVYDKLLWLLSKFSKEEVEIVSEASSFSKNQEYLSGELQEIVTGKANFIEVEEAEKRLEIVVKKHENSI